MREYIEHYSREGEVVFDPFVGSGVTAIESLILKRRAIACDLDPDAITIVTNSVSYLTDFLASQGMSSDVTQISQHEIRAFILYLQQKQCFSGHRLNHAL